MARVPIENGYDVPLVPSVADTG